MNYVDDGYVIDDLLQLVRKANEERIKINWIPDTASEQGLTPRVLKSIASYKEWLPKHIENAGASIDVIREFRTDIFVKSNTGVKVQAYLVDDRGKEHVCDVLF